jgi:FK506-binding protein 1
MKKIFSVICLFFIYSCLINLAFSEKLERSTADPDFVSLYQVKHLQQGDDETYPKPGHVVKVHYTGTMPDTGKKFDSSRDRNSPFTFTLRRGQVIQCWDEVVSRMSKGEKIYVICPARYAYGERGAGRVIPPNADIAFEIELLETDVNKEDL